jgi:hypothetical protein
VALVSASGDSPGADDPLRGEASRAAASRSSPPRGAADGLLLLLPGPSGQLGVGLLLDSPARLETLPCGESARCARAPGRALDVLPRGESLDAVTPARGLPGCGPIEPSD